MSEGTAEVVIVGGGSTGTSIAYHLAARGVRDVVLVERDTVAAGSTGRSSAIIRQHYLIPETARMVVRGLAFFEHFSEIVGGEAGFVPCGFLAAVPPEDVAALRANVAWQRAEGVRAEVLSPAETRELVPRMRCDDLGAAAYEPTAGYADPAGTAMAFASRARELGARVLQGATVTGIERDARGVAGVITSRGRIATRAVVNAAGVWGGRLGRLAGVELPLTITRHRLCIFERDPAFGPRHPIVSDFVRQAYYRPEGQTLTLVGNSEPITPADITSPDDDSQDISFDTVQRYSEKVCHRFPALESAGYRRGWAGLYDMSPDGQFILDQVPELPGFYVALGLSGHGFKHCPVIGEMMADLITTGHSDSVVDISFFSLRRFAEGRVIRPPFPYSQPRLHA